MNKDDFNVMTELPFVFVENLVDSDSVKQNTYCVKRCKSRDCIIFYNKKLQSNHQHYRCSNKYDCYGFIDGKGNKYLVNGIIVDSNVEIPGTTKNSKRHLVFSQKSIEQKLQRSIYFSSCNDSLERDDIEKNYSILHDIRAAMGLVSKYLDSFIQEQKGRHFNEKLDNSSSNLKNLHDAVDLTRDQMEMIDVIINPGSITNGLFKKMNIYRLFERVSKLMRAKAEDKNVNITWHSHDQIKDTYCYNSIQFIPLILLDNAIKYSSKGKAIRIYFDVINSVSIQIRVSSFGRTVPSDEADKIFKKFIQGSNSKAYSSGGMGVGLWVLSKIVEAHDGFIKYENDESEFGVNNFIVTLPYLTENPVVVTAKSAKNAKRRFWS